MVLKRAVSTTTWGFGWWSPWRILLGISVRTLPEWEQGRCSPTGAARTLLRVAETHPEVLRELAAAN